MVEASDLAAARAVVRGRGLLPIDVAETRGVFALPAGELLGRKARGLSIADLTVFTRQMATLISSGVQVEAALAAIAGQSGARLKGFCISLRQSIMDGESLSAALSLQWQGFDRYFLTSVEAGERAGRIGAVFERLAEHVESRQRNRQTIALALIYPAILILVSLAVILALLVFVLPDIVRVFAARGADLPRLTQLMIAVSDGLTRHGFLILVGIAAVVGGGTVAAQRPAARSGIDGMLWRLGLSRQMTLVQFTGTLATLTQSGVALADALGAATSTVANSVARARLRAVVQDVRDGVALSHALARQKDFPPMMITMIASGEASGRLPQMLGRFADDQAENLQARVKTLVGLVEPLVLLAMGGVVMLLVLAILMPIVNLNSLVG